MLGATSFQIKVPDNITPVSKKNNMVVAGRRLIKNNKVKDWEHYLDSFLNNLQDKRLYDGPVKMTIHFIFKDNRRRDAHNLIDIICDVMQGYLYNDDSQIHEMLITKEVIKGSLVTINIKIEHKD